MAVLEVPPGTRLESLGTAWAVFSVLSGETHLLNHEAAALLEVLQEQPRTLDTAAAILATDLGLDSALLLPLLEDAADEFLLAGLVRPIHDQPGAPRFDASR